jgi:glucosamine 6-phosphate synthetase-like amidotransferase/phosphosugar isomerase protein
MCGIFGIIANEKSKLDFVNLNEITNELFILSESRGKESAGIAIKNSFDKKIQVLKHSKPASQLVKSKEYQAFYKKSLENAFENNVLKSAVAIIAHARLVTNGSQENNNNNQPCIKDGSVTVHNGIITNVEDLWKKHTELQRNYEVDTEIFLTLIKHHIKQAKSIKDAVQLTYQEIKGTASTGIFFEEFNKVVLSSNNASLYYALNLDRGIIIFASENHILQTIIDKLKLKEKLNISNSTWSEPNKGWLLDLDTFNLE